MVYLHSYFNRKSEASVRLLEDKKKIKSNDMDAIMQRVNQISPLTEDQFHDLLDVIDCIQRNCNQRMILEDRYAPHLKERLFNLFRSNNGVIDELYFNVTKLAQHRNTFFSQTKWNWFGLNRTNGIIQLRELLEAKKSSLLQTEQLISHHLTEDGIKGEKFIQVGTHPTIDSLDNELNIRPLAVFHVSQCQQVKIELGVAGIETDIFGEWNPYPSVSNKPILDSNNDDTLLERAKSLSNMPAFVTNDDTPINRAQSLPNEKYRGREKSIHEILWRCAARSRKKQELKFFLVKPVEPDNEIDFSKIPHPQDPLPSVEHSLLYELLCNPQNPE